MRKRKGNTLTIECRNRFDLGEELQFCFPNIADDFSLVPSEIRNEEGEVIPHFSGGQGKFLIDISSEQAEIFHKNFGEGEIFALVRKPKR